MARGKSRWRSSSLVQWDRRRMSGPSSGLLKQGVDVENESLVGCYHGDPAVGLVGVDLKVDIGGRRRQRLVRAALTRSHDAEAEE